MVLLKFHQNQLYIKTIIPILLLMLSISISQIKYVLALEKEGSFSEAADKCFVTQSTLSTMVKKMEEQLKLVLFDRRSKPIKLTEEGKILIDQFKLMYQEFENLEDLIETTKVEFYGNLSIGIIPTLAPFLLPLFLDDMTNQYPNVNFSIDEITTNEITERIKKKELDIGILSLPVKDKELVQKTLFYEDFLIYDTNLSAHLKKKKKYKIADIDINRLWLLEESHCLSNQIENICQLRSKRKLSNNLVYNCGSILSLIELVHMNNGLTLLPRLATHNPKLINNKFISKLESPQPVREIGLVMHPNFYKKKLQKMLEAKILDSVKPYVSKLKKMKIINPF